MRTAALLMILAAAPASAACTPGNPALSGQYFLDGVMEMGSELRLYPNGQFEFGLAYGAIDQYGKGCWKAEGETLTLLAQGRRSVPAQHTPVDRRFRGMWLLVQPDGSLRWPLPGFRGVFRKVD